MLRLYTVRESEWEGSGINLPLKKPIATLDNNAIDSGVDTVDKMYAGYSISRVTGRWLCVIFCSFEKVIRTDFQVFYLSAMTTGCSKYRGVFLNYLSINLIKEYCFENRSENHA